MRYPERGYIFTDHDGTLGDSEKDFDNYSAMVIEYHHRVLGVSLPNIEKLMDVAKKKILSHPEEYGWERGAERLIVAAASSDHFVFNHVATSLVLDYLMGMDPSLWAKIMKVGGKEGYIDQMFIELYPKLGVTYRPEAKAFLTELYKLQGEDRWAVVTNSSVEKVAANLRQLNLGFEPRVIGGAKKYDVNRKWNTLLPTGPYTGFEGFPRRGVELQRETFYQTLHTATGGEMNGLAFVEDIAEFVLWLDFLAEHNPNFGDVRTALVLTPNTPEWERKRYTDGTQKRFGSSNLLEILAWLKEE